MGQAENDRERVRVGTFLALQQFSERAFLGNPGVRHGPKYMRQFKDNGGAGAS